MIIFFIALLNPWPSVFGLQQYQAQIPNGENVVDAEGNSWAGVGHMRAAGAGPRNPFGLDFAAANHNWTLDLCTKDSDGDGRSNGAELGDPQCLWQVGDTPQFNTGITHPGFSNPGAVLTADPCKDFQLPEGTRSAEFLFTDFPVLSKDTSYIKQAFTFPEEGNIVRFDIVIDEKAVVHHMILYKCSKDVSNIFGTPKEGGMPCQDVIYAWAVGGKDYCFPHDLSMYMETDNLHMALEIHYDNPSSTAGILDSSGFRVHYKPGNTLTAASWLWVGATIPSISVPPKQESYEIQSTCDLSKFGKKGSVKIFASILHGHKLARKIWLTKQNKNSADYVSDLICNANYDFDLQEMVPLETEVEISTDDILTVHCVYDSSKRDEVTPGGDATEQEMCIALIMFYPEIKGVKPQVCMKTSVEVKNGVGGSKKCDNFYDATKDIQDSGALTTGYILSLALVTMIFQNYV